MAYNIDSNLENADWTKNEWDFPPYKSDEFQDWLESSGLSLSEFKKLPVYRFAVEQGLIIDDEWAGKNKRLKNLNKLIAQKGGPGSGNYGHGGQAGGWGGSTGGGEDFLEHPKELRGSFDPETGEFDLEKHLSYTEDMTEEEYEEYDQNMEEYLEEVGDDPEKVERPEPFSKESMDVLSVRLERVLPDDDMQERKVLADEIIQGYMRDEIKNAKEAGMSAEDMAKQFSIEDHTESIDLSLLESGVYAYLSKERIEEKMTKGTTPRAFDPMKYSDSVDNAGEGIEFLQETTAPEVHSPERDFGNMLAEMPSIEHTSGRAGYNFARQAILWKGMGVGAKKSFIHEYGHHIEDLHYRQGDHTFTHEALRGFFDRRTEGEVAVEMFGEKRKPDSFIDAYVGRVYPPDDEPYEVLSVGAERMYTDPEEFLEKDPEHFALTLAIMHGGTVKNK